MSLFSDFRIGFKAYSAALSLMSKSGWWKYLWVTIPAAVILIYFGWESATELGSWLNDLFKPWLLEKTQDWNLPDNWFTRALFGIFYFLMKIFFFFLFLSCFKYVYLILLSPFFSWFSGLVYKKVYGIDVPFSFFQIMKDALRSISIGISNFLLEIFLKIIAVPILLAIPVLGWLSAPVIGILLSSFFYGTNMIDFTLEQKQWSAGKSLRFMYDRKGPATGNGLIFALSFSIPIIGTLLAPAIIPLIGIVAGTIAIKEREALIG